MAVEDEIAVPANAKGVVRRQVWQTGRRGRVVSVAVMLGLSLVAVLLSACEPPLDPVTGGRLDVTKLVVDPPGGYSESTEVSMNEARTSIAATRIWGNPDARYVVLDHSSDPDASGLLKELEVPGVPTYVDGSSQLSADGKTFVATFRADEDEGDRCSQQAYTKYTFQQVIMWKRSSARGKFADPTLVSHRQAVGADPCEGHDASNGVPLMGVGGNRDSSAPSVSRDGSSVAFVSQASDLGEAPDTALRHGLFVRDGAGPIEMVTPANIDVGVTDAAISANGLRIAFTSEASNIVAGVGGGWRQAYLAKRATVGGAWSFELVSQNDAGAAGDDEVTSRVTISEDGARVSYVSGATNLDPGIAPSENWQHLYVRDVTGGKTRVVLDRVSGDALDVGSDPGHPALSLDGNRLVEFTGDLPHGRPAGNQRSRDRWERRIVVFDATAALKDAVADRKKARLTSRRVRDYVNESGAVGIGGKAGRYEMVFPSTEGAIYEEDESALYVVGGQAIGSANTAPFHGDPVDTSTGNFAHQESDLVAPQGPSGAALTRSYASVGSSGGIFGPGWTTGIDLGLDIDSDEGQVNVELPGGRVVTYTSNGSTWSTTTGYQSQLSPLSSGWKLTDPSGATRTFDSQGRLTEITEPDQPTVSIDWTGSALAVITASNGYSVTLSDTTHPEPDGGATEAGEDGLVDRAVSSDGLVIDYGYRWDGGPPVLASVSAPHRIGQDSDSFGRRSYETQGRLITRIIDQVDDTRTHTVVENDYDPLGRVASQVSDNGDAMTFHYGAKPDSLGVLVDADGYVTVDDTASGDRTVYHYAASGAVLDITDANGNSVARTWTGDQSATATTRDGVVTTSTYDKAGRVTATTETKAAVTRPVSSVSYVVADTAPTAKTDDRVAASTDKAGVTTTFVYDEAQSNSATLPWKVQTPCVATSLVMGVSCPGDGKATTTMVYGTGALEGLVTSVVDADGVTTDTAYDAADRSITSVTTHPSPTTIEVTTYDTKVPGDAGWSEPAGSPVARVQTVTGPGADPAVAITKFDAQGRVLEERDPLYDGTDHKATRYEYWLNGGLKSVTDPADHVTTYDTLRPGDAGWDEPGGSAVTEVSVTTDPDGVESISRTDRSGDVVAEQTGDRANPATLATTSHTYGPLGRLETTSDSAGVVTRFGYDIEGRVTQTTTGTTLGDPNRTTSTVYDQWGQTASRTGPVSTDPDGATVQPATSFTYDQAGRTVTRIEGPASEPAARMMTAYQYDGAGQLWRTIEHRAGSLDTANPFTIATGDKVTESRFSVAGRTAASASAPVDQPAFDWNTAADGSKAFTLFGFDGAGRQVTVTDPQNRTTTTSFDDAGRVGSMTSPAGRETSFGYDAAGRRVSVTTPSGLTGAGDPSTVVAKTAYWADGQVRSETDPHVASAGADLSTRTFTYTPGGRLDTVTDALGHEVSYSYDDRGNRVTRTGTDDNDDPVVQSWTFDLADRVTIATTPPPRPGADPSVTINTYDPVFGWLATVTDATGNVETRGYYNTGSVKTQTWTKTGQPTVQAKSWINARGWQTKTSNTQDTATSSESFGYDRAGQRTSTALDGVGSLGYSWDLAGNMIGFAYADGAVAAFTHTPAGQVTAIDMAPDTATALTPYVTYSYDADGIMTDENLVAAGGSRHWDLDDAGRPVSFDETLPNAAGTTTYGAELSYRPDGRLRTEQVDGGSTATYGYDNAGQLKSVTGGPTAGLGSWTYGTRGNRLTSIGPAGSTTYQTNPNGSVAEAVTGGDTVTYDYDDAGRRTLESHDDGTATTQTLTTGYDTRGTLTNIETAAPGDPTQREDRLYDAAGLTTRTTTSTDAVVTAVTDHLYDTNRSVAKLVDTRLDAATWTRHEQAVTGLIALNSGTTTWIQQDARGSVINTDPTNTNLATGPPAWTAWGQPDQPDPITTTAGYRQETTTNNLIYLRNRNYDPTTGQFLTQDPLDSTDGSPANGNPYPYTDNNPVNKVDPLGLRLCDQTLECYLDSAGLGSQGVSGREGGPPVPCGLASRIIGRYATVMQRSRTVTEPDLTYGCTTVSLFGISSGRFKTAFFRLRSFTGYALPNDVHHLVAARSTSIDSGPVDWVLPSQNKIFDNHRVLSVFDDTRPLARVDVANAVVGLLASTTNLQWVEATSKYYRLDAKVVSSADATSSGVLFTGGQTVIVTRRVMVRAKCSIRNQPSVLGLPLANPLTGREAACVDFEL